MSDVIRYGNGISFVNKGEIYTQLTVEDESNEVSVELMYGKIGGITMRHNLSYRDVGELYSWLAKWLFSFQGDKEGDVK